jgi:hypothetical protein
MGCLERFFNWLNISNMPTSEQSIIRDLMTIGAIES